MELVIDENNETPENHSNSSTDIVSNIERALENPQIQQMVGAIMAQNGIDPEAMGLDVQTNDKENRNTNTQQMASENQNIEGKESSTNQSNSVDEINAQVVLNMVESIAEESPMGENTTLGMVKQHIEQNPEKINNALEENGIK